MVTCWPECFPCDCMMRSIETSCRVHYAPWVRFLVGQREKWPGRCNGRIGITSKAPKCTCGIQSTGCVADLPSTKGSTQQFTFFGGIHALTFQKAVRRGDRHCSGATPRRPGADTAHAADSDVVISEIMYHARIPHHRVHQLANRAAPVTGISAGITLVTPRVRVPPGTVRTANSSARHLSRRCTAKRPVSFSTHDRGRPVRRASRVIADQQVLARICEPLPLTWTALVRRDTAASLSLLVAALSVVIVERARATAARTSGMDASVDP